MGSIYKFSWDTKHSQAMVNVEEDGEPHLLLDAAAEVLPDELLAGGCLQLQVPLQSLEWQSSRLLNLHT